MSEPVRRIAPALCAPPCNHPLPCREHGEPVYTQLAIDVPEAGRFPAKTFKMAPKVLPLLTDGKCEGRATGMYGRGQCKAPAKAVFEEKGRRKVLCAMHLARLGIEA